MKKLGWIGIVWLVGCGGGSSSVSIQNFPQKYAETLCAKNFQCCGASELTGKTQSQCVTDNQSAISFLIAEINASQAQGRVSYDPECQRDLHRLAQGDDLRRVQAGHRRQHGGLHGVHHAEGGAGRRLHAALRVHHGELRGLRHVRRPARRRHVRGRADAGRHRDLVRHDLLRDGAYCDSTSTCVARKAAGETCTSDSECVNTCDTASGTCSCYSGCHVGAPTTPATTALSALLLGAGFVVSRARRRRREGGAAPTVSSAAAAAPCARAGYGANRLHIESG